MELMISANNLLGAGTFSKTVLASIKAIRRVSRRQTVFAGLRAAIGVGFNTTNAIRGHHANDTATEYHPAQRNG